MSLWSSRLFRNKWDLESDSYTVANDLEPYPGGAQSQIGYDRSRSDFLYYRYQNNVWDAGKKRQNVYSVRKFCLTYSCICPV